MRYLFGLLPPAVIIVLAVQGRAQDAPPLPTPVPLPSDELGAPNTFHETSGQEADRLERSLAAWDEAKRACGGDYIYVVRFTSGFGFGHATTITVRGNRVSERKFERWDRPEPGRAPEATQPEWVETGDDIGSHADAAAAPARTVDELYAIAKSVVVKKLTSHEVRSLAIDARGLMQACVVRDTRIADDAPSEGVPPFELKLKNDEPVRGRAFDP